MRLYYAGGSLAFYKCTYFTLPVLLDQDNLPPGRYLPDVTLQQSACLPGAEITSSELICLHRDFAASSYQCPKFHLLGGTTGSLCLLEKFWLVSENVSDAWPRALAWLSMFPEALCLWGIKDIEILIKEVVPKKRFKVKKKKKLHCQLRYQYYHLVHTSTPTVGSTSYHSKFYKEKLYVTGIIRVWLMSELNNYDLEISIQAIHTHEICCFLNP